MDELVAHLRTRISELSAVERYEDALVVRERLRAVLTGAAHAERLRAWARIAEFVAARPVRGRWEMVLVRHGRLAATGWLDHGQDPGGALADLHRAAEYVPAPEIVGAATPTDETDLLISWCQEPGVRLVEMAEECPPLALPVCGAHRWDLPPRG